VSAEQLPLDFNVSVSSRLRKAREVAEADARQAPLFAAPPNLDIHLHSVDEAIASIAGTEPERAIAWLERIVGPVVVLRSRRVMFPASALDRLLWALPPAQVTVDAAAAAVARGVWAHKLGLKPLMVRRDGRRLLASSPRSWPSGLKVVDAPWTAVMTLNRLGVPLVVADTAQHLFADKLAATGQTLATAGLSGTSALITTTNPETLERLALPGLAYAGPPGHGTYRLPLLAADVLLRSPQITCSPDLTAAIKRCSGRVRPIQTKDTFPVQLYPFQARDVAKAVRILHTTGGALFAAEMGTGKTWMSLAAVDELEMWPLLVVAPLSAFSSWERELAQLGRRAYLATESPAKSWDAIAAGDYDAVVISYDRLPAFVELIETVGFAGVVADEIQRIRTPGSKRSRALRSLAASIPLRIGLSGTPLTNRVEDLLPLGAFLVPGEWRPRASSKDLSDMYPGDPVEGVAEHLGTMMVRRRMTEIGKKIAQRRDHRVFVQLTPEQRRALEDLKAEAEAAKEAGAFDDNTGKLHAFVRLQRMRQIVADPQGAGIGGPNPKIETALDLAQDFLAQGRKGVIFCADRNVFTQLGQRMTEEGIGWVGIWGSTPVEQRIANEQRFHTDPSIQVVLCTIQAGAESWSASPTATWLISSSYVYSPSALSQMEARVHRLSSRLEDTVDIIYVHAQAPGGTIDDRFVEIIELKRQLFAQVVDRTAHVDTTKVHLSMGDLVFMLTGTRDERIDARDADASATVKREQDRKRHARVTAHAHKGRNKTSSDVHDDGSGTITFEEYLDAEVQLPADLVIDAVVADEGFDVEADDD
jgi:superfamily II DNA or RNA helicase